MRTDPKHTAKPDGRMAAIVIAITGLFWIGTTWAGGQFEWSNRIRALADMMALAGFAFALILTFRIWRARQTDEG